jgi:beta-glucanase (GH16 family)
MPNTARWIYDTEANKSGWYNNELQYYAVKRPQNSRLRNGKLVITARKERLTQYADYGGQNYSSARLITRGKFAFTYGYVEVRAKLACGQGIWPAIWMLGSTGNWPDAGEIDVMEHINNEKIVYGTIHTRSTAGTSGSGHPAAITGTCTAFHTYHLRWTPAALKIGVDGRYYHTYTNKNTGAAQWPFSKPQYLLLNLAVGGNWPGKPNDKVLPQEFVVDYVRVYQKK